MNELNLKTQNNYFNSYYTQDGEILIVPHILDVEQPIELSGLQILIREQYAQIEYMYIALFVLTVLVILYRTIYKNFQ